MLIQRESPLMRGARRFDIVKVWHLGLDLSSSLIVVKVWTVTDVLAIVVCVDIGHAPLVEFVRMWVFERRR